MLKTYYRTLWCLTVVMCLTAQIAIAETVQVRLLNPDGSPAADAQAVAVMTQLSRVDANLKELPSLISTQASGSTVAVNNGAGVLKFDSKALAVLAQSPSGFAFMPLPLAGREVKLRPWAKLKIDLSTLSPKMRKPQRLTVMWENCFAGNPPRPYFSPQGNTPFDTPTANTDTRFDPVRPTIMSEVNDPFGNPAPTIDWRFDPLVTWSLALDMMGDQVVNVPPGEVTVVLSDEDLHSASPEHFVPRVRYSPVRTLSGKQATFKAPEVANIRGQLIENSLPNWNKASDGGLPNWNKASDSLFVIANRACEKMPKEFAELFTRLSGARDERAMLDELARRYASDIGMRYRYELLVTMAGARVDDDGSFELANVPVGKYDLVLMGPSFHAPVKLKRRGDADNQVITIELTDNPSPLDVGEVERAETPREQPQPASNPAPPVQQPAAKDAMLAKADEGFSVNPIETAEQRIKTALLKRVDIDFQGISLRAAIDEFSTETSAPIRLNLRKLESLQINEDSPVFMSLPRMTLHSALRNVLSSLSDELTFTIRDEVLLITTKEDASQDQPINLKNPAAADVDTGAAFLEYWQKLYEAPQAAKTDQAALRKALQDHLEQEFDAKQQARRQELAQLRSLLKQSEDWLNTRQQRRAEIVDKKLQQLLEKANTSKQ